MDALSTLYALTDENDKKLVALSESCRAISCLKVAYMRTYLLAIIILHPSQVNKVAMYL